MQKPPLPPAGAEAPGGAPPPPPAPAVPGERDPVPWPVLTGRDPVPWPVLTGRDPVPWPVLTGRDPGRTAPGPRFSVTLSRTPPAAPAEGPASGSAVFYTDSVVLPRPWNHLKHL
jgi:hypothetical protein